MVLEISQIPSRLVDAMLKLHRGKPEGSLDQTGKRDEESVPKAVELIHDGFIFKVQIWIEAREVGEQWTKGKKGITQQSVKKPYFIEGGGFECTKVMGRGHFESEENLNFTDGQAQRTRKQRTWSVNVEEATPLNYTELPENFEPTSDSTIPLWVRQSIINLGKEFGIHFNGCEEIAEELFMKIDGKRQRSVKQQRL
ncbi:hypothetical protein H5410_002147 [Solanum commersonii]|uniref:Uncharacterized protein n=1 Tax=Solanum commersonii TaxID=4109 RepID=A0A9J6B124_SOLCO|nr:hypothetical protein H5410_002147 [Solanum commersonii]